jgi:hypothetical protein
MGCLVGCLAAAFPRLTLVLVWLLNENYLKHAYEQWYWPVLGFVFLPTTTLAFAFGMNTLGKPGVMEPLGWLLVAIALLMDLGTAGSGSSHARERMRRDG